MDVYQSKPVFKLVSVAWVKSMGYAIINNLWVRKIKLNGAGTFSKLNPRWCAMGTNMDRDLYESYAPRPASGPLCFCSSPLELTTR